MSKELEILISGASGFVGSSFVSLYKKDFKFRFIKRNTDKVRNDKTVLCWNNLEASMITEPIIHLAGKSLDSSYVVDINEYYEVNTELTKKLFDLFLESKSKVFIMVSSVKAVADSFEGILTEDQLPNPKTHYGKSKLLAENYILSKKIPNWKRVYILRPAMIYGPKSNSNLRLLFNIVSKGVPWPLGAFKNARSFCSIDNLHFVFKELIERCDIPSGVYNVCDDETISTNELILLIAHSQNKKATIWMIPQRLIRTIAQFGDALRLPVNSERLKKLTESYVVSNAKLSSTLGKSLPVSSREGLRKTFSSFSR